jgi:type II secretory pathway pseudopilin PulG
MSRLRRDGGFQLIEGMMVTLLLGVLGMAITSVVASSLRTERVTDDLRTNLNEARVAVERMRLDVREARRIYPTSPQGVANGPAQLAIWRDVNQDQLQQTTEQVTYRFSTAADGTGQLERRTEAMAPGQWRVIARHLDMSTGTDGKPRLRLETAPTPPKTRTVTMVVTVVARPGTGAGAGAQKLSITETVRLRNAS